MQGLGVTFASFGALGAQTGLWAADRAVELGYDSWWTAEATGPEAFSMLGAVGARQPSLDLGTGVLALQLRTPLATAMGAATLQSLNPDRTILLGIGVSSPAVANRWHGARYTERPLAQTREFATLVQRYLTGEAITHDGDFYRVDRSRLGVRLGDRKPKLVLAALNPKMLALAGEIADGVLLNYVPASHVAWSVAQVRAAEHRAGRPHGSCTVYAYVHVGVADRAEAAPMARRDIFSYAVVPSYARSFARAGFAEEVDAITSAHAARDREAAVAAVSDRMVDAIDIVGDHDVVGRAVTAYVEAGVDVPVIMPLPWGPDRRAVIDATMVAAAEAR